MMTLFDAETAGSILSRIARITPQAQRQWGRMSAEQMLAHCNNGIGVAMGTVPMKRVFIGRLIGPFVKKKVLNGMPMERNLPTVAEMIITATDGFENEKQKLIAGVKQFAQAGPRGIPATPHPFFGKMTGEEWGISAGKHLDHHLRQFGV